MKLDPRIKKGKRPLTCLDVEQALEFVGKECIFSDFCLNYLDIEKFNIDNDNEHIGILSIDDNSSDYIFINTRNKSRYRFILPCEWVEEPEKKYKPYTIKDFEKAFLNGEFEDFIIFRDKHNPDDIYTMMYNGNFRKGQFEYICLGAKNFSFESLFENYEVADYDGEWRPFGVEISKGE